MRKLLNILIFALISTSLSAQYVIDLSQLDYIESSSTSLDGQMEIEVEGEYVYCYYKGYVNGIDSVKISDYVDNSIDEDMIKVSDIPAMSISDWEELLNKHDIIWNDEDEDLSELRLLTKKGPYYMLYVDVKLDKDASYCVDDDCNKKKKYDKIRINNRSYNGLDYQRDFSINYIKLKGDKYLLCLINDSDIYKFMPAKGKFGLKLSSDKLDKKIKGKRLELYSGEKNFIDLSVYKNDSGKYYLDNGKGMSLGMYNYLKTSKSRAKQTNR